MVSLVLTFENTHLSTYIVIYIILPPLTKIVTAQPVSTYFTRPNLYFAGPIKYIGYSMYVLE